MTESPDLLLALQLSYLPYRRSLYRSGGWCPAHLENSSPHSIMENFYTLQEIRQAADLACSFMEKHFTKSIGYVTQWEDSYPPLLAMIFDSPPVLFWIGANPDFMAPMISVVGTRNPAPVIEPATRSLISDTISPGITIVSGFARGVDRIAHRISIEMNRPTIAVLGSGIFHPGPVSNMDLIEIAERRAVDFTLLSEFPPDARGAPYHFPRRNRIIAGISARTCVMQAPPSSGSLITAQYALDEGREVFIFDHPLLASSGFNDGGRQLIRDGASMLELEKNRIVLRPSLDNPGIQKFWKKDNDGQLTWLGGDFYYDSRSMDGGVMN